MLLKTMNIFLSVLLVAYKRNKPLRNEITINFILGVTGLAVYPLLALVRFLALFKIIYKNE